jgi:hypothetical protein
VLGEVAEFDDLIARCVGTLDIKILVDPEECPAADGGNLIGSASVGTLELGVLTGPNGDAHFAGHFAASVALVGIFCNVYADEAEESLMINSDKAVWVIT